MARQMLGPFPKHHRKVVSWHFVDLELLTDFGTPSQITVFVDFLPSDRREFPFDVWKEQKYPRRAI